MADSLLQLSPPELVYRDVNFGTAYTQQLQIRNDSGGTVELELRPGSSDRYTISPSSLRIAAGAAATVSVTLKLLKFAQRQRAIEQGQRDNFHIKVRSTWRMAVACRRMHTPCRPTA